MPFQFLVLDITFDVLSGIVALLVSYYAFRYNRLLESVTLKFLSLGFVLLGMGLLAEAGVLSFVLFSVGDLLSDRLLAAGTTTIYSVLQVAAYFVLALGYIRGAYDSSRLQEGQQADANPTTNTSAIILIALAVVARSPGYQLLYQLIQLSRAVSLVSEVLSIIFLSMIVFQGALTYAGSQNKLALLVLVSFSLILLSQGIELWSAVSLVVTLHIVGAGIQFAGFLSLLIFILWRTKFGSA